MFIESHNFSNISGLGSYTEIEIEFHYVCYFVFVTRTIPGILNVHVIN